MSVSIVLLAAGASSRMRGEDKLLQSVDGRPLLRVMAERCVKAAPTRVVIGPDQPDRRLALDGLDVEIVEATETDGMAASLRRGIDGLTCDGALVAMCDMPEITASDLHVMISLWEQRIAPILQAATEDGTPGHPVLFAKRYFKEIARIDGDRGAAQVLKDHAGDVALLPLKGQRARIDLDTPEDWARWRAAQES